MTREQGGGRQEAIYGWLLHVYPAGYRRDLGSAAIETFGDLARQARRDGGLQGLISLWAATLPRVIWGGLSERVSELRHPYRSGADDREVRPPYGWALLSALVVLGLYAATLAPTTAFWDTSEYIATAHTLGIPHPPGNPLFVLLARSWEILTAPLGLSVAVRVNLFSAAMSASAHGLWFLVVHQILSSFDVRRGFRIAGASAAVLLSATAFTVWNQSDVNEKVYTVSLFTIALLTWLALRWQAEPRDARANKLLALIAFVLGLSVGNHLMAFLAAPALATFIAIVRPRAYLQWRLYPAVVVAGALGLSVHLFLPIRAALGPIINEGAPLCDSIRGAVGSVLSYGRAGCEALSQSLNRQQYQKPPVWERQAPFVPQLMNYLQYFDWQWARGVDGTRALFAPLRLPFTALFTGLGVLGALEHHRRDRTTFWYVLALLGTVSLALVVYMNFEYGFSFPGPVGARVTHEVRERDYFFIVSFSLWGLWAGIGIAALWLWLSRSLGGRLLRASPVLGLACLPLILNAHWADRSYDHAAHDYAYNLLQSVEPYSVLFTSGDNDTFPLWYLQEVEGVRRDVTVIVRSYLATPWYAKQLRDLTRPCRGQESPDAQPTRIVCQRSYVPGPRVAYTGGGESPPPGVVALVMTKGLRRPAKPIMELDDETIDRIARSYVPIQEPISLRLDRLETVLQPGQVLEPWQQYALAIVDTAFTDARPVYWDNTGPDPSSLGLDRYLVRQGVAFKLNDGALEEGNPRGVTALRADPALLAGTGRWVDVPRTEALLDDVFLHHSGLPRWDHWPDASTVSIPYYYGWAYYALAVAAQNDGEDSAEERYARLGEAWIDLVTPSS